MRAFIAIELDSDNLRKTQKEFDIRGVKLTDHFHLTLKFFKEISEEDIEKVKTLLKTIKFEQFDLELTNLGVFPKLESFPSGSSIVLSDGKDSNYVRVIWVGAKSEGLVELQKKIDEALIGMFEKESRFSAHITIGRVKFVTDKQLLFERIKNAKVEVEKFNIEEFKLIKSTLEEDGPVYEDLAVFKLG